MKYEDLSSDFTILPPSHWTCSFVCHFNSTESIQSCSRLGAFNLSYTLPSLSYQVLIFTWVKWSIWGWSALPKDTTSKKCPNIERGEHDISLKSLHQAGFETARQAATSAERHALTIAPCPSLKRKYNWMASCTSGLTHILTILRKNRAATWSTG